MAVTINHVDSKPLLSRGYLSLLATQFFGAANDNILKQCLIFMVTTGIWSAPISEGGLGVGGQVIPMLLLTVPFIFLSGYAGQLTDGSSKRNVAIAVKVAEVPIAMLAFWGFYVQNLWLTLAALLLLSVQSTFFGPTKYGIIPELVQDHQLSMANGLLNMFTNLAVISGSMIAGPLAQLYAPRKATEALPVLWAPGAMLVVVALAGLACVVFLPKLVAAKPNLKYDKDPFATYWKSLYEMSQGPLLTITLAWSAFYMVATLALLIIPEYAEILDISYPQTSVFLGVLGIAIAAGSVMTGWLSGHTIKPNLIPLGATGMTITFLLLGTLRPTYANVAILIFAAGFSAGFYIVPLQSLLQHLSPDNERGRFLGTANALSFCFSSLGAVVYWVAASPLHLPANRIHLICGAMGVAGTMVGVMQLRRLQRMTTPGAPPAIDETP